MEPLPADSTVLVRPRSALGLKYLEVRPGEGQAGFKPGATIPIRQARPEVVEIDDFFNMFDDKARVGSRNSLDGFGTGLAGRGRDLNTAIDELRPLLDDLEPVAKNLAEPAHRHRPLLQGPGRHRVRGGAGGRGAGVAVREPGHHLHGPRHDRPAVSSRSRSPRARPPRQVAINEFPKQRPFLRNNAAFFRELQPGVATLPHSAPILADAFQAGHGEPAQDDSGERGAGGHVRHAGQLLRGPAGGQQGVEQLTLLSSSLNPTLKFITPVQTTCNYATLFFRNAASVLSEGDENGTWQRFTIIPTTAIQGTEPYVPNNNEIGPSSAPSDGPGKLNHIHSNPYPNTASPGQTKECEAGNERYQTIGKTLIGNPPGNQGIKTSKKSALGDH